MKSGYWIFSLLILLAACRTQLPITAVEDTRIAIVENLPQDQEIAQIIAPYKAELDAEMNRYLSYTPISLDKQGMNNTLGIFAAEALKEVANTHRAQAGLPPVDIVLINIGGLRRSFAAGPLTVGSMYELMPFENEAVTVTIPGESMEEVVRYLRREKRGTPIAGVQIYVDDTLRPGLVNHQPIEKNRSYTVLTNDYLLSGGDGMGFFTQATHRHNERIKIRDMFIEYLEKIDTVRIDRAPAYIFN